MVVVRHEPCYFDYLPRGRSSNPPDKTVADGAKVVASAGNMYDIVVGDAAFCLYCACCNSLPHTYDYIVYVHRCEV